VIDCFLIRLGLEDEENAQCAQQQGDQRSDPPQCPATQRAAPGPNKARQPSHNSCCRDAAGTRCP
jgi:hypothetical protein